MGANSSLKDANRLALYGLVVANALAFVVVVEGRELLTLFTSSPRQLFSWLPAGTLAAFISLLGAQLSADNKARLVFGKWKNPLPGCRAFSKLLNSDSRINVSRLRAKHGPFPTKPAEQNSRWYAMYKSVENQPAVRHSHREYLFTRDYAVHALFMLFSFGPIALLMTSISVSSLSYLLILILQFVLARRAAQSHGNRLVTTVLAIKAAEAVEQ